MAGSVQTTPGYDLQPSGEKLTMPSNYITNFDFLNQYLPDTYEKEFERYGNRSIASFLRMVGAELPSNSDLIKWAEQGRLHIKYTTCTAAATTGVGVNIRQLFTVSDAGATTCAYRVNQTVFLSDNTDSTAFAKAIVTDVTGLTFTVAYYEIAGNTAFTAADVVTAYVYGSEFAKGTQGMLGSVESEDIFLENKPVIIKNRFDVAGSDMAQIGWVEVTSENGATGFLWYLKSEHDTRLRFDDQLEMAMVEGVNAEALSGAQDFVTTDVTGSAGSTGTEGLFEAISGYASSAAGRGNVWSGGNPTTLADFDAIIQRLDKQGAIQENVIFLNRQFGFDIDDMLAAQNSYGAGGTSYGLFDNDEEMALNLGFSGFKRGYEFYKTDWKYLNDAALRGGLNAGIVNGVLVPAGTTNVYDQILGKNAKRPFLHVRYRASETEDRRYKTWITGSAGGARTSSIDAMEVHFLSERALCVMGANNFFMFQD
tara:strand:+ start:7757 stop:9202 length:1446 start_codon:yes stop_codon:yes gene_type:complete